MKRYCLILASGTGSRFGANCPKQYVAIKGKMIIEYTLSACDCGVFDEIVLVVSASFVGEMRMLVSRGHYSIPITVVEGGASRFESCERGVAAIKSTDGYVVIHNGVQPFIAKEDFVKCLSALEEHPAVTAGLPCVYTILETDGNGVLQRMPPRKFCYSDLGPECFRLPLARKIFELGHNDKGFTNLTAVVMKYQLGTVFVVEGRPANIKITYPEDIVYAERIINGETHHQ